MMDREQKLGILSDDIALNSTLSVALEYGQCPTCLYVFENTENFIKTSTPCPKCGARGTREIWPGDFYKLQLFPVLQGLYSERDRFGVAVVVFAFAISEGLLRRCLLDALHKRGLEYVAAEQCVEKIGSAGAIVQLLANLCSRNSLADLLERTEFRPILSAWEATRNLRNKIMHAQQTTVKPEAVKRAFSTCVQFSSLLRYVLNQVPAMKGRGRLGASPQIVLPS